MHTRPWFVRPVLGLCLVAMGLLIASAEAPAAESPLATQIYNSLKQWFKDHANKDDNTIGKVEAAKAFGYPKPYDAGVKKPVKKPAKKDDKEEEAKSDSKKTNTKTDDSSKYANRSDYLFIHKLDKNGDEKVDEKEFDTWAHQYAAETAKKEEQAMKQQKGKGSSSKGMGGAGHMAKGFGGR